MTLLVSHLGTGVGTHIGVDIMNVLKQECPGTAVLSSLVTFKSALGPAVLSSLTAFKSFIYEHN